MPKVYNWHIGRDMEYPYPEKHPGKQFVFVFNLNRCIGCQTCTISCKSTWTFSRGQELMWWNNVETKPYGGYPQFWDVKTLALLHDVHSQEGVSPTWETSELGQKKPYGTYYGFTLVEAAQKVIEDAPAPVLGYLPSDEEWRFPNIYEDTPASSPGSLAKGTTLPAHETWFFYLPRLCNHCEYPFCLAACPRKAIYKRPEDGIVLIDQHRCRGYKKCVSACPYKRPMFRPNTRISEKCIGCYPRIEGKDPEAGGSPLETRCMTACVGKIRMQGLVNIKEDGQWAEDPDHPLYYLIKESQVALPLYPQFGAQPGGYYIPPRWAPRDYLRQMFGPGVDKALKAYEAPSRKLLAVLQLFRASRVILAKFKIVPGKKVYETTIAGKPWAMYDDTVVGFGSDGGEVIRVKVEEPLYLRPSKYYNSL